MCIAYLSRLLLLMHITAVLAGNGLHTLFASTGHHPTHEYGLPTAARLSMHLFNFKCRLTVGPVTPTASGVTLCNALT